MPDLTVEHFCKAGVRFVSVPVRKNAGPYARGWGVYFFDPDGIPMEMTERCSSDQERMKDV